MTGDSAAAFRERTGVSRETTDRLSAFATLLAKWQRRINLIGPKTLPELWTRHMLDSAQAADQLPANARRLADFGSGGGFPGLVLAAIGRERGVETVTLVEADQRKAAFLREAARVMGLSATVTVRAQRLETLGPLEADVVTARALASVSDLLRYVQATCGPHTPCVFLKGKRLQDELTDAKSAWYIKYRIAPSSTDPDGAILIIEDFADVRTDSGVHDAPQG
ncbi:MAG: 16S rRNA (guanine(527)-N(7))-methyltransferase RsmG [Marivibrio sp.]|uniref:16S rRNA (guanine(527)-N(7))-methyltransferase RsmG n=1 Tax=Marivibrio sp. TaxID=2039719 RepID=UPI0032EAF5BB